MDKSEDFSFRFNRSDLRMTSHAWMRWHERCPGMDVNTEWALAHPPGRQKRKKIKEEFPSLRRLAKSTNHQDVRLFVSPHGAIFLVGKTRERVVTVLKMRD